MKFWKRIKNWHGLLPEKKQVEQVCLERCTDVEFLRMAVEDLWTIIDDIDTYSDIAKENDKLYRKLVEKRQAHRWRLPIQIDENGQFIRYIGYDDKHMEHNT